MEVLGERGSRKEMKLQLKQLDLEIMNVRPPIRVKHVLIKRYHRKKRFELSLKLVGQVPQLQEPDKEWVDTRMKGSARSWERWDK